MRGIAILAVMAIHYTNFPPGGLLGVDIFFTLSGFLITTLLLEEWRLNGSISLRNFYIRRYYRLVPGLAGLIVCYVAYVLVLGRADVALRLRGAGYAITYTANWVMAFNRPYPEWEIGHLWSLAVEEQFYLVWPVVLLLLIKWRFGLNGTKWALVGMIAAVVAWRNVLFSIGADGSRLYFGTDTRFDQLLVGCLAAVLYVSRGTAARNSKRLLAFALPALGFVAWRLFQDYRWAWSWRAELTLFAIAVAVLIYACVTDSFPVLKRVLSTKWLVFVGTISYSLYLWHVAGGLALQRFGGLRGWPLVLSEVVLAFGVACASFYLIERPFLRRRKAYQSLTSTKAEVDAHAGSAAPHE